MLYGLSLIFFTGCQKPHSNLLITTETTKAAGSLQQSSAGSDLVRKDPSAVLNLDPTQDNTKIHNQIRVQSKTNGTKTLRTHCGAMLDERNQRGINTQERMIKQVISKRYTTLAYLAVGRQQDLSEFSACHLVCFECNVCCLWYSTIMCMLDWWNELKQCLKKGENVFRNVNRKKNPLIMTPLVEWGIVSTKYPLGN